MSRKLWSQFGRVFILGIILISLLGTSHSVSAADPIVQTFYVPMPETGIQASLKSIYSSTGNQINTAISLVGTGDSMIIYYDHWEDGYEADIENPVQSTTEIWGDGNSGNGIPPGFGSDVINEGTVIALESMVGGSGIGSSVDLPRNANQIRWDGGDKFAGTKAIVATRASWAQTPGTVLAGAVEFYDTSKYNQTFEIPFGEDQSYAEVFQYVGMFVAASQDGTSVTINKKDGSGLINTTLNEGESYHVDGDVNTGATVSADKPVQVHVITGDIGSRYESRWFTMYPKEQWAASYYNPTSTTVSNDPAHTFIFNPSGSPITINYETQAGSGSFTVPAGDSYRYRMPTNSAAHFYSSGGETFFAVGTMDSDESGTGNNVHDWGFTLVPESNLTPSVVVGWGPVNGNKSGVGSPVWVTTIAPTTIYVKYDGNLDAGPQTAPNGHKYDVSYDLSAFESKRISDSDGDNTGMRIFTADGTFMTAAWGQDPSVADPGNPYLDMGTTVLPLPIYSITKEASLAVDVDGDGLYDPGDTIEYKIVTQNDGVVILGNVTVEDTLPAETNYIAGTTKVDGGAYPDDTTGTAFPLDQSGFNAFDGTTDDGIPVGDIAVSNKAEITFQVQIDPGTPVTTTEIANVARASTDQGILEITEKTTITHDPPPPTTSCSVIFADSGYSSVSIYSENDTLYIQVNDGDQNTDNGVQETIEVLVSNQTNGDSESLTLTEVDADDNLFRGSIPSSTSSGFSGSGDGTLFAEPGDSLRVEFSDSTNGDSCNDTATIQVDTDTKTLYLSDTNDLDRVDPVNVSPADTSTSTITMGGGSGSVLTGFESGQDSEYEIKGTGSGVDQWGAQSFSYTSGSGTYSVGKVGVYVKKTNNSGNTLNYRVAISTSASFAGQMWYGTFTKDDISANNTYQWIELDVSPAVNLTDGTTYYIVVDTVENVNSVFWGRNGGSNPPNYADGNFYEKGSSQSDIDGLFRVYDPGSGGTTATFTQSTAMAGNLGMPAGTNIVVTTYIENASGMTDGSTVTDLSATVKYGSTTHGPVNAVYTDAATDYLTWTFSLSGASTIATGNQVVFDITNVPAGVSFDLKYDSDSYPSKIDLPTNDLITVDELKVYDDAYAAGTAITSTTNGQTVYVRVTVSDPFGNADITSTDLVIALPASCSGSDITATLTDTDVVATTAGTKTYEYKWVTGVCQGEHTVSVTAKEGYEGTITATQQTPFWVNFLDTGTPCIADFVDASSASVTSYTTADTVYVQVTDIDKNTDSGTPQSFTADVKVNGSLHETATLTETGNDTGIFQVTYAAGTFSDGDVLLVEYVDANAPSDTCSDTVPVASSVNTIGDFVWNDTDKDGIQDAGETGIQGVVVRAYADANTDGVADNSTVVASDTTDSLGAYSLTVPDGSYVLEFDTSGLSGIYAFSPKAQGGDATKDSDVNTGTGYSDTITVSGGATNNDIDAGLYQAATISDFVWYDTDKDGIQDSGEGGIPGVVVKAYADGDAGGTVLAQDTTDSNGAYSLTVAAGAYVIEFDTSGLSGTYTFSAKGQGSDVTKDSNVNPGTGYTDTVIVSAGDNKTDVDAGTWTSDTGTLSGHLYIDTDGDGNQGAGEPDLANVDIIVTDVYGGLQVVSTDANGNWSATVPPGSTTANVDENDSDYPTGYLHTQGAGNDPTTVVVNTGANTDAGTHGYKPGTISGQVRNDVDRDGTTGGIADGDDSGLAGASVSLYTDPNGDGDPSDGTQIGSTIMTDATGNYSFTDLGSGNYVVVEGDPTNYSSVMDKDGDTTDPAFNRIPVTLAAGGSSTGNDFLDVGDPGTIVIVEDSDPNDAQDFAYTGSGPSGYDFGGGFSLDDDSDGALPNTRTFSSLVPGSYSLTQGAVTGWSLTNLVCSDPDSGSAVDLGTRTSTIDLDPGETVTCTYTNSKNANIRGTIYEDANGDGDFDAGESGISGVTVYLDLNDNGVKDAGEPEDTTDANGDYEFLDRSPGSYVIRETNPAGYTSTGDTDGANDDKISVTLTSGTDSNDNDFFDMRPADIRGTVYEDSNGDGDFDAGETGISGVTVYLDLNDNGVKDAGEPEDTTDANGDYEFLDRNPGDYVVRETNPAGYTSTGDTDGANDDKISVTLTSGTDSDDNDFFDMRPADIRGTVYEDTNGDGDFDAGETGISGVTVYLDLNDNGVKDAGEPEDTTDANGDYEFLDRNPGDYVVRETNPAGYTSTGDTDGANDDKISVTLTSGTDSDDNDFFDAQPADVRGTVYEDTNGDGDFDAGETGISGVTVYLDLNDNGVKDAGEPEDTTDANGDYEFLDRNPGTYVVRETNPAGYTSTGDTDGANDDKNSVTLTSGTDSDDNDFFDMRPADIRGTVYEDSNGDGDFDAGESGINGVTVYLDLNDNGVKDAGEPEDTTDANGDYEFLDRNPGDYVVRETNPAGYTSTGDTDGANDDKISVTLTSGTDSDNNDFFDAQPADIRGTVYDDTNGDGDFDAGETGISGVTVYLDLNDNGVKDAGEPEDTTDANGDYEFADKNPGTYVVRETNPAGYNSTGDTDGANDDKISVTLTSGTDSDDNDFFDARPADMRGTVYDDTNGDGDFDAGETGISGVTVYLDLNDNGVKDAGEPEDTTDANGDYEFLDRNPGDYVVRETNPAGYTSTGDTDGANDDKISVTLTSGTDSDDNDYFDMRPADIRGTVYEDANGDGDFDAGETGISSVTVYLDLNDNGVKDAGEPEDTTDANGDYEFLDRNPGSYVIRETNPAGYTSTGDTDGANDDKISVTLTSGTDSDDNDYFDMRPADIRGTVYEDANGDGDFDAGETGISGVTVYLDLNDNGVKDAGEPEDTTDANGDYEFLDRNPGDYIVRETNPAGYTSTGDTDGANDDKISVTLTSGTDSNDNDFFDMRPADIRGTVYDDTNGDGDFDAGETGISGVTVYLDLNDNGVKDAGEPEDTTDANGDYEFLDRSPGTYVIRETNPAGYTSTGDTDGANDDKISVTLTSGTDSDDNDFFDRVSNGDIRGTVYDDANGDGDFDAGETGISGVTVYLDLNDNGVKDAGEPEDTTNASGDYEFLSKNPGTYVIRETNPAGYTSTGDTDGANDDKISVTLVLGADSVDNDFFDMRPADIRGTVYEDTNGDGDFDAGETGISGVTVYLDLNDNGVKDAGEPEDTTNASGDYEFLDRNPGDYVVRETNPAGYTSTGDTDGANDDKISVTLTSGTDSNDNDFFDVQPADIRGTVYADLNGNGSLDAGETGISGVTVYLDLNDNGVKDAGEPEDTTDANGDYEFLDRNPGTYVVREINPAGYTSTGDTDGANDDKISVTLTSGTDSDDNDFFDDPDPGKIQGTVYEDTNGDGDFDAGESGISGVTVYLDLNDNGVKDAGEPEDTTDANGDYEFTNLDPGSYVVRETNPAGYTSTGDTDGANDDKISVTVSAGETEADHDFFDAQPADIRGTVYEDSNGDGDFDAGESGISGVTVYLDLNDNGVKDAGEPEDTTDANGDYEFLDRNPGAYVIRETNPAGYTSTGDTDGANDDKISVTLTSGTDSNDNDYFDVQPVDIRGTVYEDSNGDGNFDAGETGISGVTVYLDLNDNGVKDAGEPEDTTDANGDYEFADKNPGSYVVRETNPAGYTSTGDTDGANDDKISVTLTSGMDSNDNDFFDMRPADIRGTVYEDTNGDGNFDAGESGISGVTVYLDLNDNGVKDAGEPEDTTDANGDYEFLDRNPGDYVVRETNPAGYNSTGDIDGANDDKISVTLTSGSDSDDNDFFDAQPADMRGTVYEDTNGDGDFDAGETGINGVTVYLDLNDNGIKDAGEPEDTTDANGDYEFLDRNPGDYVVRETNPAGYTSTGDTDGANDDKISVALTSGTDSDDNDFFDAQPADIRGTVYEDANGDGDFDAGESGISGVTVYLDLNDNGVKDAGEPEDTTDANGDYEFLDRNPGDYVVRETNPAGYTSTGDTDGANDDKISVTLTSGTDSDDNDYFDVQPADMRGTVYEDANGDGNFDAGETGISGVTVYLDLNDNGVKDAGEPEDTTDANGDYEFLDRNPGSYVVRETNPAGYTSTGDTDGANDDKISVTLTSGTDSDDNDFFDMRPADIRGTVYDDTNGDGNFDAGESGISGVTVYLDLNDNGVKDAGEPEDTTDANGDYEFLDRNPGDYVVREINPAGYTSTGDTDGANDDKISVTLTSGTDSNDNDFFDAQPADMRGTVYEDTNGDGDFDAGESGISGVTVYLDLNDNGVKDAGEPEDTTDANGDYEFLDRNPGDYVVRETNPAGYTSTGDTDGANDDKISVALTSGTDSDDNDFFDAQPADIRGTVYEDANGDGDFDAGESGINGVTVYLDLNDNGVKDAGEPEDTTDANGDYEFLDKNPGDYVVRETNPAGYTSTGDTDGANDDKINVTLTSGTDSNDNDFFDMRPADIRGTVYEDTNGDGNFDAGETGISGVTVYLDLNDNGVKDAGEPEDTTDANGDYEFLDRNPGDYVVRETNPAGYNSTGDTDGANDDKINVTLTSGTDSDDNDFFDARPADMRGTVYDDTNGDGDFDAGETGISGVTVYLDLNDNGVKDAGEPEDTTDANGDYEFLDRNPGDYVVRETNPAGYTSTGDTDGANDDKISVTLTSGTDSDDNDFFDAQPADIRGTVYEDANGDGDFDAGESGISGVTVYLDLNDNGVKDAGEPEDTTDANGDYEFLDRNPGTYVVRETNPAGYTSTGDTDGANDDKISVTLTSGTDSNDNDFFDMRPADIRGTVYQDLNGNGSFDAGEAGISGVTVYLDLNDNGVKDAGEPEDTTDANGDYEFLDKNPGDYVVREINPANYTSTGDTDGANDDKISVTLTSGTDSNDNDFFDDPDPATIRGTVYEDANGDGDFDAGETGISGVTVYLDLNDNGVKDAGEPEDTTDANGDYEFTNLDPGTYVIRETNPAGYTSTGDTDGANDDKISVTVSAGETQVDHDFFDIEPSDIRGTVYGDLNGNGSFDVGETGISGVTVYLDLNDNGVKDAGEPEDTTDANGDYEFADKTPGTYVIREINPANYVSTGDTDGGNDDRISVTLGSGVDSEDNDFFDDPDPGKIQGTVYEDTNGDGDFDAGEPGISSVTVYLDLNNNGTSDAGEPEDTTDALGAYEFLGLDPRDYIIREINKSGYTSTGDTEGANDDKISVTLSAGETEADHDFFDVRPADIRGTVYEDTDGDGGFDVGEPGLSGVTVYLDLNDNGTKDAGEPEDTTDANGDYEFLDNNPGSYVVREVNPAGYTSTGDTDGANDDKISVTLTSGTDSNDNDFFDVKQSDIRGTVYEDLNGNGVFDTGEKGISGVTIYLDLNDNGTKDAGEPEETTDANGDYEFTNLTPGIHVLREVNLANYTSTGDTDGANDDKISVTITSGTDSDDNDFFDKPDPATIQGTVYDDTNGNGSLDAGENGISGVVVYLDLNDDGVKDAGEPEDTTDGNGDYEFNGLNPGTYVVREVNKTDYASTGDTDGANDDKITLTVTPGALLQDNDFFDVLYADLSLTKGASPSTPVPGATVVFTITITNSGPGDATGVQVTDQLPSGYSFVSSNAAALVDSDGNAMSYVQASGLWDVGSVDVGASFALQITATVNATGSYANVAQVTAADQPDPDSTPNNDDGDQSEDDEASTSANPGAADLSLSKSVDNTIANVGDYVKFTLKLKNDGPSDASGVRVSDKLPDGYSYVTNTPSQGTYDKDTGVWDVGSIVDGGEATLQITAKVLATGEHKNVAQVTASNQDDPDSTPNNDDGDQSEDDEASSKVGYTNVFDPPSGWKEVNAAGWPTVVWRQVWINNGNASANPVRIVDSIPNGTTYVAASLACDARGASTTTTCTYDAASDQIVWVGSIASDLGDHTEADADHEVVITFSTTVPASMDQTENQGRAYWDQDGDGDLDSDDANVANNNPVLSDDLSTTVVKDPTAARNPAKTVDLELNMIISDPNARLGDVVTFTLTLNNRGPDSATGVEVRNVLPPGYTYEASSIGGNAGATGATITPDDSNDPTLIWGIDQLDNGESVTLTFQAKVNGATGLTNSAQVTAQDQPDVDSSPANDDGDQSEDDEDSVVIATAQLGNFAWIDDNPKNGLQDPDEEGLASVRANLYGDLDGDGLIEPYADDGGVMQSQITGSDGAYLFTVAPGTYLVEFVIPDGYALTFENAGDDNLDNDANQIQPSTLGDRVWLDDDKDGLQDGAEIGYANVTLNLFTDVDGDGVVEPYEDDGNPVDSLITDDTGFFEFVVNPGIYVIEALGPAGWACTELDAGADDIDNDFVDDNTIETNGITFDENLYNGIIESLNQSNGGFSPQISVDTNTTISHVDIGLIWLVAHEPGTSEKFASNPTLDNTVERTVANPGFTLRLGKLSMPIDTARLMQAASGLQAAGRTSTVSLNAGDIDLSLDVGVFVSVDPLAQAGADSDSDTDTDTEDALEDVFALPRTGFAPGRETIVEAPSEEFKGYRKYNTDMTLEIPALGVASPIIGVPLYGNDWGVAWLGNEIGYLEGTAFPTTNGNTALSAHAYLPSGEPGPFAQLNQLGWGDRVDIVMGDLRYTYEVRQLTFVEPDDLSPLRNESHDWITLITCYQYDEELGDYRWRVVVRAVLIETSSK